MFCFQTDSTRPPPPPLRPPRLTTGRTPSLRLTRRNVCRHHRRHRHRQPLSPSPQLPPPPPTPWDTIIMVQLRRPWSAAGRNSANPRAPPPPPWSTVHLISTTIYYDIKSLSKTSYIMTLYRYQRTGRVHHRCIKIVLNIPAVGVSVFCIIMRT